MRTQIVAELATGHGGDVALAADMIRAAADAGADLVKIQSYSLERLNPRDPQVTWLTQSHLGVHAHETLIQVATDAGVELFSTPFDNPSLGMLRSLKIRRIKIASSESANLWWSPEVGERWIVSHPWGKVPSMTHINGLNLTAIPLYPTPLESVGCAALLDGWSDHCEGITACQRAIVMGAKMIEVHLTLPGRSREKPWDKSPAQIRELRQFAEQMETIHSGVAQVYRDRWTA